MNKPLLHLLLISMWGLATLSCTAPDVGKQTFDLKLIAERTESGSSAIGRSSVFDKEVLHITPREGHEGITIWEKGDKPIWTQGKYLVFEVYDKAQYSGVINLEFYKDMTDYQPEKIVLQGGEISGTDKDMPWISCLMGMMPQLKTQMVFPLSYLDAQQIFIPRSPRQLKGTVSGNRLDPADITKVVLRFGPYDEKHYQTDFELASVAITDEPPVPYPPLETPIIDKIGQWKGKDWPGKVADEQEMTEKNRSLANRVNDAAFPSTWSRYGGWKQKRFQATGFFRTQHDGQRWWLVDPEGYAFLSVGIDCIRANSEGPVNGIEDLFEWLPDNSDPAYGEALQETRGFQTMDFYIANLIRMYGSRWKEEWTRITQSLMKSVRCNTVGNWSDIDFARNSRLPYVLPLNRFPNTEVSIYRDFPDVFSEEYRRNSQAFAAQLEDHKDDPYMVGYFLRNEPQWAFGYHNLAYEMFATDQLSETKKEFIRWLSAKYGNDVQAVNQAWNLQLPDFDALLTSTFKTYPSDSAKADFHAFSAIMVKRYVDIPCDEVEKVDSNHLNLGMRYAWLSSDLLYKAGERFDVFSINGYGIDPPPTAEIAQRSGKPVMIGEFHQGAADRALPATGIVGVLNQEERAAAYRNYIEQGFARPELVGMHYFQWIDQPFYGRFDGENYNIGVVTTCNLPYPELTEAMKQTNERIYDVASGRAEPYKADIEKTPAIHY